MKKLLFILFVFLASTTFAQNTITGKITDKNNIPVKDVIVSVKGDNTSTLTDENGKYSINVPANKKSLEFSKKGYRVQVAEISGTEIDLSMSLLSEFDVFELSIEELLNVEVTSVSKKSESVLSAPQTVIVITEDEIQKRGYTDIEQVIHDLPGFDVSRGMGCEYSQIYQRGYRSNNTDRTMIMIDGVEQNDLWSGSAWIARQYPVSNIKRIEVVYGPASTVYGANAFLGVINVITKEETDFLSGDEKFGCYANAGYGNWNTRYGDVTLVGKYKDLSLNVTGRLYQTDNMDLSEYDNWDFDLNDYDVDYYMAKLETSNADSAQMAMDLDKEGYKVNGVEHFYENKANDYFINASLKIKDLTVGFQHWTRAEQYGSWYRDIYEFGTWTPSHSYVYSKYEKKITNKLTISSYNTFKVNRLKGNQNHDYWYVGYINGGLDTADLRLNTVPYWYESYYATYSQQFRSELKAIIDFSDKFNITSGIEYRQSIIQGNYIVSTDPNPEEKGIDPALEGGNHFFSTDIGFYAQANYKPIETLSLVLGARADNNKIRINQGYGTVLNPKAAIVFTPLNFIFKVIYSEAFKDADNLTKYSTTAKRIANPLLQPEKVKNFELDAGWQATENLFFDVTAYQANYSNIANEVAITYVNEDGVTVDGVQNQPVGELLIRGIQSRLNFKYKNYSTFVYYTFTDPYNTSETEKVRIGDIATHKFTVGANAMFFRKLNFNLIMNYVGDKPTGANTTISSNPNDVIDAYMIINGAITYNIYKGLSLQIAANNILDTEYFHPGVRSADGDYYASEIPQYRRNFLLKLLFEF